MSPYARKTSNVASRTVLRHGRKLYANHLTFCDQSDDDGRREGDARRRRRRRRRVDGLQSRADAAARTRSCSSTSAPEMITRTSWTSSRCSSCRRAAPSTAATCATCGMRTSSCSCPRRRSTVDTSRLEYLARNAAIADELADELPPGRGGVIVDRHESRRSARDAVTAAYGSRPEPRPRLHAQRQPPAAHRPRTGAGCPAGQCRRLG